MKDTLENIYVDTPALFYMILLSSRSLAIWDSLSCDVSSTKEHLSLCRNEVACVWGNMHVHCKNKNSSSCMWFDWRYSVGILVLVRASLGQGWVPVKWMCAESFIAECEGKLLFDMLDLDTLCKEGFFSGVKLKWSGLKQQFRIDLIWR